MILDEYAVHDKKTLGPADCGAVARELQRKHPTLFGKGAAGFAEAGLQRQYVRRVVQRSKVEEGALDGRGRAPALPATVVVMIVAALALSPGLDTSTLPRR
eukprot:1156850-Prymnesium_polylepis.1